MPMLIKKELRALELILSYWKYYQGEDKFFVFNPYTQKFILGIKQNNHACNAPYTLYPLTFFAHDYKNCARTFEHYCIIENDKIIHNSFENFKHEGTDLFSIDALLECFCGINNVDFNTVKTKQSLFERKKHNILRHDDSYDAWRSLFAVIQDKIAKQEFEKIVVARKIDFECEDKFNIESIILNLYEYNINSYVFAFEENGEIFFGASPELLIEKNAQQMRSFALAGTIKKTRGDVVAQGQSFLCDVKNTYEHKIVMNAIAQSMQKLGKNICIGESHILELKNILHIKTDVVADECDEPNNLAYDLTTSKKNDAKCNLHHDKLSILSWVNELHPTPALGGSPKDKALEFLMQYESFSRNNFGAPLGVVDANGDGFFIVGIRSASIKNNILSAYAGCGIVGQSDCNEEFEEIDTKLKTIIEAL